MATKAKIVKKSAPLSNSVEQRLLALDIANSILINRPSNLIGAHFNTSNLTQLAEYVVKWAATGASIDDQILIDQAKAQNAAPVEPQKYA